MKPPFAVTYTIRETEILALLDRWVTNTPFVTMLCPQRNCVSVGLLRSVTFFLSPVNRCVGELRQIAVS